MATGVAEVGSLFPRLRASIWESCWQKVHRTVARDRFAFQNVKKLMPAEHFCRSGWQNVHGTVARARFQKKKVKKWNVRSRSSAEKSALLTLSKCWSISSIWCGAPALRVCNLSIANRIGKAAHRKAPVCSCRLLDAL